MAGPSLLQGLLVALVIGISFAQVIHKNSYQDGTRMESVALHFPRPKPIHASAQSNPTVINSFAAGLPMEIVRTSNRPRCSQKFADTSAPCVLDQDYDDSIRNLVNNLLMNDPNTNEIIRNPEFRTILNDTLTPVFDPGAATTRFGGPTETPVCLSREELIFPQRAKTPKDDWVFVVNQDNVKQALRVERCVGDSMACDLGIASTSDVSTVCRQKYVYRRMLAIGTNNIAPEEVLMPSCCVCYRRKSTFDVATRVRNNSEIDESELTSSATSGIPAVSIRGSGPAHVAGQPQGGRQPDIILPRTRSLAVSPHISNPYNTANLPGSSSPRFLTSFYRQGR